MLAIQILGVLGLALLAVMVAVVAAVAIPHLSRRKLADRADLDGMYLVKDLMVSACVIPLGDHEAALVDAGMDKAGSAILAELARHGLEPGDVKAILLTHGHHDHAGAVGRFPNAQVMALAAEIEVVEGRSGGGSPLLRVLPMRPTGDQDFASRCAMARRFPWGLTRCGYLPFRATRPAARRSPSVRTCSWATARMPAGMGGSRHLRGYSAKAPRRIGRRWRTWDAAWRETAPSAGWCSAIPRRLKKGWFRSRESRKR